VACLLVNALAMKNLNLSLRGNVGGAYCEGGLFGDLCTSVINMWVYLL